MRHNYCFFMSGRDNAEDQHTSDTEQSVGVPPHPTGAIWQSYSPQTVFAFPNGFCICNILECRADSAADHTSQALHKNLTLHTTRNLMLV